MEYVAYDPSKTGVPLGQFVPPEPEKYTAWDVVTSAFLQENELVNMFQYATRPTFNYDPSFDPLEIIKSDPLAAEYGGNLGRATSQAEYNFIRGRILAEKREKEILASSGFGGFAAAALAGLISPTSLVPVMGPARGVKGVAQAFMLAGAAVSAQEAALYGLQEIRSGEEVAFGVGAGTVLGGLLGSAARHLTPDARARLEADMVDTRDQVTILRTRDDGATEEIRIEPEELPVPEPVKAEFERVIKRTTSKTLEEELEFGKRPLSAELPGGYTIRFVKQPAGGGGAYFTGGEYGITIFRPDGTRVDPPQLDARSPDIGLAGNTLIEKEAELKEAFAAGKLDEQIDRMLEAAGEAPITTRAAEGPGTSVGAARVDEAVGGIRRSNTYVGRVVNRGTDWLQRQSDKFAPQGEGLGAQIARFGVKAVPNTLSAIADPIGMLAKLNPVTRQLENKLFPSSQKWAARLQVPGVKLEGGYSGSGDMVSRSQVHMKHVAKFIRDYDTAYANYVTNGQGATAAGQARAAMFKSTGQAPKGKLSYADFAETVFRAGNTGEEVNDPYIQAAIAAQRTYYDQINKIANNYFNELKAKYGEDARRMYDELEFSEESDIQHYVHHIFNTNDVQRLQSEFLKDFSEHGEELLKTSFRKSYEAFAKKQKRLQALRDILGMDEASITSYAEEVRRLREDIDLKFGAEMEQIKALRKSMQGEDEDVIKAAVQEAEANFGPEYAEAMKMRREIGRELSVLNKAGAGLSEEQARLLEQLGKIEDMQLKELDRFADAAARFKQRVARLGEAEARNDAQVQKLAGQILKYAKLAQKQREALAKARKKEPKQAKLDTAIERMENKIAEVSKKKGLNFDEARAAIDEALEGARRKTKELNSKRTIREERLKERIEEADPEARAVWRAEERTRTEQALADLEDAFDTRWRERGATGNPARGDVDFAEQALADAQELYKRLVGNPLRVSGAEVIGGARGAQLQRMLNLPFEKKAKYLMRDPEKVIRAHGHSMFPDLELYRATGSVNGAPIKNDLDADYAREQARIQALPEGERAAAAAELDRAYKQAQQDWEVLITRFRHQRGVPRDPDSLGYRLGRVAMNLNVTRFMGMVALSSLPDLARPVFRYGLTGTFRDAWFPLINDMPRVKAARAEAERLGIALDPLLHNRAAAIYDVGENYANKQTLAERGLEFLSNKTGFIALFDRWTAEMKHMATNAVFAEVSHALRVFNEAQPGSKEFLKAQEQLKHMSIDGAMAQRIWRQYLRDDGSSEFKNGFRLPNTEVWDDFEAVMALSAGVQRVTNDLIVTPALDRPSWMDENTAYKLVAQFRSFTFTSTNRILMSGLQEADMAYLQGTMFSLALGAMSYYTWAASAGGRAYEEAMQLDTDQWIYEAVARSGLLGVLSEGQRIGEQIPGLSQFAIFGAQEDRTQRATSVLGAVLGPSYDLAERLTQVAQGIDDPTQSTLHAARKAMVPYQNVFYLRQLLDKMEEGMAEIAGLPERRGQ